jgi:outer membrane lipoprotein-sorting protein
MRFLRTISTARLLVLALAVTVAGAATAAIALAATGGGGQKPPPKPLAQAVHDALAAPPIDGVTARIKFTNHLVDSSALPGATPLLSGATGRLWASAGGRLRLELQSTSGDVQIVTDGGRFLVYDGSSNTAYRGTLPQKQMDKTTGSKRADVPSLAAITKSIAQVREQGTVSGATPTTVAGQPAYQVRIAPLHGGLVSSAQLAWDAVRGVPLKLSVFARGNGAPVLALTAQHISFGSVPASTFAISPPKGAKLVDVNLGGEGPHSSSKSVTGAGAVQRAVPFQLAAPQQLSGRSLSQVKLLGSGNHASALVTYGQGLDGLAVIEQKADGQAPSSGGDRQLPSVTINGSTGQELPTALGTVVRFTRGGVQYTVLGSQPPDVVIAAARAL